MKSYPTKENIHQKIPETEEKSGRKRQGHRDTEEPATSEPPRGQQGPRYRPRATKGGANRHRNGSRHRHAARGTGARRGGWQAAGVGDVQVGGASHWERRWGAGARDMDDDDKHY